MSSSVRKLVDPGVRVRARHGADRPRSGKPASHAVVVDERCRKLVGDLAPDFLAWQCRMVAGIMRGAVFLAQAGTVHGEACARWPERGKAPRVLDELAARALSAGRGEICSQVRYSDTLGQVCDAVSVPVQYGHTPVAVVVVTLSTRSEPQQRAVLQLIEWGVTWFETLLDREVRSRSAQANVVNEIVGQALDADDVASAARDVVTSLAARTGCERISLGMTRKGRLSLLAASGVDQFDRRTQFVSRLEDAMEEAAVQQRTLVFPASDADPTEILRAQKRLADTQPGTTVMTAVAGSGRDRLALVAEFAPMAPPVEAQLALLKVAADALARPMSLLRRSNQPLTGLWTGRHDNRRPGRRRRAALVVGALVALLVAAAFVKLPYRVSADAGIVGSEQRTVVAPIAGFIESTTVRPGDDVREGDLLAELDTRDLELERAKWRGLEAARRAEYQDALASRDRTQISVLRARLDQIAAELELVDTRIARATLRAPYAGIIVSGDLSQSLDSPVDQGQVLFEIAPLTAYRVVIEVDEHDIADVRADMTGHLRLAALPGTLIPFRVERVLPVAASGEGHSYFRVEATLAEQPAQLRPGMRGVAKIAAGQRSALWLWTHALVDRLRLTAWSLGF